jgi:hypothetical protein
MISVKRTGKKELEPDQESMGGGLTIVTLFLAKNSLTKTNWGIGALS